MMKAQGAKDPMSRVKALAGLRPKDLAPHPPAIADRSTGGSMGDSVQHVFGVKRPRVMDYAKKNFAPGVFDNAWFWCAETAAKAMSH